MPAKNSYSKIIIPAGIIIAFILVYLFFSSQKNQLTHPKVGSVVESIYGLGTVTADKIYRAKAATPLTVQKVFVKEGQIVKANDPLIKLDENIFKSQIEGTVTEVLYKDGELVNPQTPAITVVNLKELFLEVSLEQQSILRVKKNQKVSVSFESLRQEKFEGRVTSIYPRNNQFIVRIELITWPDGVLPGMTADVAIWIGQKDHVLLIPVQSIVSGRVQKVQNGHKENIAVKLGIIDGEWAEVLEGDLKESDELILRK